MKARSDTPVSEVRATGVAAAGNSSLPIKANACCGRAWASTATPGGALSAISDGHSTATAFSVAISPALRLPSTKTSACSPPSPAEAMVSTTESA